MFRKSDLKLLIDNEKHVENSIEKLIEAKTLAATSLCNWIKSESNPVISELCLRMYETDRLWGRLYQDYAVQHSIYRGFFKEILRSEKELEDLRKQHHDAKNRLDKTENQYQSFLKKSENSSSGKKSELQRHEVEWARAKSLELYSRVNLTEKAEQHEVDKYQKVRRAFTLLNDANRALHEKCLLLVKAQEQILQLLMKSEQPENTSKEQILKNEIESSRIVNNLVSEIRVPRPGSFSDVNAGRNFQVHQYFDDKSLLLQELTPPVRRQHGTPSPCASPPWDTLSERPAMPLPQNKEHGKSNPSLETSGDYSYIKPFPPPRPAHSLNDLTLIGPSSTVFPSHVRADTPRERAHTSDLSDTPDYISIKGNMSFEVSPPYGHVWEASSSRPSSSPRPSPRPRPVSECLFSTSREQSGPVNQVMNWNTQGYTNNAEESGKSSTYQKLKFKK